VGSLGEGKVGCCGYEIKLFSKLGDWEVLGGGEGYMQLGTAWGKKNKREQLVVGLRGGEPEFCTDNAK